MTARLAHSTASTTAISSGMATRAIRASVFSQVMIRSASLANGPIGAAR